jgi:hypothetical protein
MERLRPLRTIDLAEIDKTAAEYLRRLLRGKRLVEFRDRGNSIARLEPILVVSAKRRAEARARLRAIARKGLKIGYKGPLDRDSLHERGK